MATPQDHSDPATGIKPGSQLRAGVPARPRTRDVVHRVIEAASQEKHVLHSTSVALNHDATNEPTAAPSSILFNKTWNIYKTTPFYSFSTLHYSAYEYELAAYITANSNGLSSSAVAEETQGGMLAFVDYRPIPTQTESLGHNVAETPDDLGDISGIKFQDLMLGDIADHLDGGQDIREDQDISKPCNSLLITINIGLEGKTWDEPYYCAILSDQTHTQNSHSTAAFAYFNLVLLKAPAVIGQLTMQWLERKFDCRLCGLLLQSYELRTIVDSSLEVMCNDPQGRADLRARPIELHYSFPESIDTLKSISISLAPDDARQLLVSRKENSIAGFLDGVEAHCSDNMKIDFGRLSLVRAGCASWYIASEGKVKMFPAIAESQSVADFFRKIAKCGS